MVELIPEIGCEVSLAVNPLGPAHTVLTITGTSIVDPNSTYTTQVRLTADPMGRTGLGVADLSITEVGAETENK